MDTIISKENATITVIIDEPLNAQHLGELQKHVEGLHIGLGTTLVLDCEGMEYISSSGLRVFLDLQKRVNSLDATMIIRKMQPLVKKVFDMTGFNTIFTFED